MGGKWVRLDERPTAVTDHEAACRLSCLVSLGSPCVCVGAGR